MNGRVVKSTGSWYAVLAEDGQTYAARIRGKFRLDGKGLTNPVAVGDQVKLELHEGDNETDALITEIQERRNYVVRQSPRKKHQLHLLASNIDQAVVIVTIVQPMLKQGFIDRFLILTEPHDIPVIIVFNKVDLLDEDQLGLVAYLSTIYEDIGYQTMAVSALNDVNVGKFKSALAGKTTLIIGQSGVGKSTLLNALSSELDLKVQTLAKGSGKGQHTTTFAEMYEVEKDTFVIDTPGIKSLSYNNLEVMDVAHNFKEFFKYSSNCRFSDCTHRNEPGCAVKEAIEEGEISELRYMNYLQIVDEIEDQNYWERHTHM